jgi:two-component system, cell cycle response regulator
VKNDPFGDELSSRKGKGDGDGTAHPGDDRPPGNGELIVVADDDRITRTMLEKVLTAAGYRVETVADGQAAVARAAEGSVDLMLLDHVMPRMSGLEACRLIKAGAGDSFLPVLLITIKTDTASRVEGLKMGADDYVCKPFEEGELLARIEAMLRIKRLHDHVAEARAKLERLSVHDELTGLYNYRYLNTRLAEEFKRAERYEEPLACLVLDVDQLGAVNENAGRAAGDEALCWVANTLRRCLREVDVVARFGGDEFLVILPSTHFAGSVTAAERIWRDAASRPIAGQTLSTSIGVALFPSRDVRSKDALLRGADEALRRAKLDGGNRVCVYQQQGYVYTPVSPDAESAIPSDVYGGLGAAARFGGPKGSS